ncbi:aminoglycoside phosphotransferase [Mycobacterium sp. 852013-51886_SCH5428379]|uniref:phosphotransferase n=1 Tax=Mycobacterium sp. 852013-51886_SCH5428379 TaxID=1834111 RepID=UPI0007FBE1DC|nr:phosphotransferase [Mycobacterium sp. 852013-51886_SCH5428379]OBB60384.1 aminoglycoside phosphotransferase [Mycobacterium sp. 852013-51886_SCH5428379]
MLSPLDIAARTDRAVAAAAAAGRRLGLTVNDPRVLYDVFSVIVHLRPAPVIVRVPTVLPPSYRAAPAQQTAQQQAELTVTGWLAERGHPVVAPSPLVPRKPVRVDGFSMTFWEYVEEVPDIGDPADRFEMTARLHAALRSYPGDELGFWTPFGTFIPEGLNALDRQPDLLAPADLHRAQREWATIAPLLASPAALRSAFDGVDVQTIHGDAPFHNLIPTADGLKWSDFELVTVGAVESDLAMAGPEGVAAYDDAAARLGLRRLDPRLLRITETAGRLAAVAALAMAPDLPMLVDGVKPVLDMWRAEPEVDVG